MSDELQRGPSQWWCTGCRRGLENHPNAKQRTHADTVTAPKGSTSPSQTHDQCGARVVFSEAVA